MATVLGGGMALDMHSANVGSILTDATTIERYPGGWYFTKGTALATEANDSFIGHEYDFDESGMLVSGVVESWIHDIYVPGGGVMGWTIFDASAPGHPVSIALQSNDAEMLFGLFLTGDDSITGSEFGDVLDGYGGTDLISGLKGADTLFGGTGDDKLLGGSQNDTLAGNEGRDTLAGGGGGDIFVFDVSARRANADRISDFNAASDDIHLERTHFRSLARGIVAEEQFTLGAAAADPDDHLIYNKATGQLFYDSDGTGDASQKLIATFSAKPDLGVADFLVI